MKITNGIATGDVKMVSMEEHNAETIELNYLSHLHDNICQERCSNKVIEPQVTTSYRNILSKYQVSRRN